MNRKLLIYLLAGTLLGIGFAKVYSLLTQGLNPKIETVAETTYPVHPSSINNKVTPVPSEEVPAYALDVLKYVETFHEAKNGYIGGKIFHNYEKLLPERTPSASVIRYKEWDVHPKLPKQNRGKERLITGDDKSAWYTADHYLHFIKIH